MKSSSESVFATGHPPVRTPASWESMEPRRLFSATALAARNDHTGEAEHQSQTPAVTVEHDDDHAQASAVQLTKASASEADDDTSAAKSPQSSGESPAPAPARVATGPEATVAADTSSSEDEASPAPQAAPVVTTNDGDANASVVAQPKPDQTPAAPALVERLRLFSDAVIAHVVADAGFVGMPRHELTALGNGLIGKAFAAASPIVQSAGEVAQLAAPAVRLGGSALASVPHYFARVDAAIIRDGLNQFINECATLSPQLAPSASISPRTRAWIVTAVVVIADIAIGSAYVIRRRRQNLMAQPLAL